MKLSIQRHTSMGQTINCKCGKPVASAKSTRCAKCRRVYQKAVRHRWKKPPREYYVWRAMISRCENPKDRSFANYGGRGVAVCARWRESFGNFAQDMMPRPEGGTMERIYNDGNYEPGHCKWANRAAQQRNRRNNVLLTFGGRTQCVTDWAIERGIDRRSLNARLTRLGWDIERALTTPTRKR